VAPRPIFRERAVEAHRRRTEKDIVPRLISTPILVCFWILLAILAGGALLAWSVRVPAYVGASGVVLERSGETGGARTRTAAVLFVAPDQSSSIRPGRPVRVRIGSSGTSARGAIAKVEHGVVGPDEARARYRIHGGADVLTQPSTAVIVRLRHELPTARYGGSHLTAQIEVGRQRLLELLGR
jgi:hypothetical protein